MLDTFVPRHIRSEVVEALAEARAVCVLGARQVGKSTLVRAIAHHEHPAQVITLDDESTRRAAREDPTGFVARLSGPTVIDEIQRVPGLLLAIKQRVDNDQTAGQFLLTGSANILTLPTVQDALPGRVEYVSLWPFSQGELIGRRESFIDDVFDGRLPEVVAAEVGRQTYAETLVTGGYPAVRGRGVGGRRRFFDSYVATILGRDLNDVANLRNVEEIERLLRLLASRSAGLARWADIANDLGTSDKTVKAHTKVLEDLFLVRLFPPWATNLGNRVVKTPKVYITDPGLLAHLISADIKHIRDDGTVAGLLLETFVADEVLRQISWAQRPVRVYHYRDQRKREVDLVLERYSGQVAAIEVKAAATVSTSDFAHLVFLRKRLADRFQAGVVLYTGARTLSFGDRLWAMPVSGLWAPA